jgi:hypothetical protein
MQEFRCALPSAVAAVILFLLSASVLTCEGSRKNTSPPGMGADAIGLKRVRGV